MANRYEVAISPAQARELTDRIKVGVEAVWQLVKDAYVSRAWEALGFDSPAGHQGLLSVFFLPQGEIGERQGCIRGWGGFPSPFLTPPFGTAMPATPFHTHE